MDNENCKANEENRNAPKAGVALNTSAVDILYLPLSPTDQQKN